MVIAVGLLLSITVNKIVFETKWEWVIIFMSLYLPFYISILSIVYQATGSPFFVSIFQYLKEFVLLISLLSFVFYQRNLFDYPFRLQITDKLFLAFYGLGLVFLFLPIGPANMLTKALYFKNVLMMGMLYFLGRNTNFSDLDYRVLFKSIMLIFVAALGLNLFEKLVGLHFQNITGYALFNQAINNVEPSGNYDLTWTFETQTGGMRLASFFSDPLELASSCLLGFSLGLIGYLSSKRAQSWIFILVILVSIGSLFFAASRASFASFFIMLIFIAVIFRLYGLIKLGAALLASFVVFVFIFASDEFYYFVVDTITFENASSVGHVIAWLEALNQMVVAPFGSGLATSGNVGSVSDELRIGGENQFLVFGVQLGFLGMFLYILILGMGIWTGIKVFRDSKNTHIARIAFIAATVKVGLLLPLFTANAELYAFVSWLTWWMVGLSVKEYNKLKYQKSTSLALG